MVGFIFVLSGLLFTILIGQVIVVVKTAIIPERF